MVQALLILHLVLFVVTKISIKIAWWNDRVEKNISSLMGGYTSQRHFHLETLIEVVMLNECTPI
jgi:hypothetical protein